MNTVIERHGTLKHGTKKISGIVGCEVPRNKHMHSVMRWGTEQLERLGYHRVRNESRWFMEKDGKVFKLWASYFQLHEWSVDTYPPKYEDTDGTIIVSQRHEGIFLVPQR